MMHNCSLSQMVDEPTREQKILDLFFTNRPALVLTCTIEPGISDHQTVVAEHRPIAWRRKLIAGLVGFVALTLFQIGFSCTLAWDKIANAKIGVYELSAEQYHWLDRINAPLATSGIILIPVLIWAMVSFRKDDWKQLKFFDR